VKTFLKGDKKKEEIMAEEKDTKCWNGSEQRRHVRRSGKDRRKTSLPVDNDRRKGQRRTGEDRRQKP
jgi:hypothetical protein